MKDMVRPAFLKLIISFISHFSFFYHLANAFMMAVGLPLSSKAPFA